MTGEVGADAAVYYAAAVEANHPGKAGSCAVLRTGSFPRWPARWGTF